MKPIAKTHIERLKHMVDRLDKHERYMQKIAGHHVYRGTPRAVDIKDAATLRKVIAHLEMEHGKFIK